MTDKELTVIELTEEKIESMVCEIRGQKVMLDFDLARIYGYATKRFNEQIKRNIEKFPEDFMFQLTKKEWQEILKCQNVTSSKKKILMSKELTSSDEESLWCQNVTLKKNAIESEENEMSQFVTTEKDANESNYFERSKKSATNNNLRSQFATANELSSKRRYNPYAFTEQGIYMLMTVLRGELAVKQSKALIRLFKRMKDYIVESNNLLTSRDILELTNRVYENAKGIEALKRKGAVMDKKLTKVMDNFIDPTTYKHFLILNGQKIEADLAYQTIYSLAKQSIHIIDDYIGVKTLHLLLSANKSVQITIVSDNVSRNPVQSEYIEDFKEEAGISLILKPSNNRCHDRFVLIDYGTEKEKIYLCGSSSKDTGRKATTITEIKKEYINHSFFDELIK